MNDIDSKREESLPEFKRNLEKGGIPFTDAQAEYLYNKAYPEALKDYGAIVEQQTRDAVIEELIEIIHGRKYEWHKICLTDQFYNGRFWEAQDLFEILKSKQPKSYFDMSDEKKRDILSQAAKQSNQMQSELAAKPLTPEEKIDMGGAE